MTETLWTIFSLIMFFGITGPLWFYAMVVAGFPFVFAIGVGCMVGGWLFPKRD